MRSWTWSRRLAVCLGLTAVLWSCGNTTSKPPKSSCATDECAGAAGQGGSASDDEGGSGGGPDPSDGGEGARPCPRECASDEACDDGVCRAVICVPRERACAGSGIEACNATGTAWSLAMACGPLHRCVHSLEPTCEPRTCTPGDKVCSGNMVKICDKEGGEPETGEDCGDEVCFEGACHAPRCEAGTKLCIDGNVHLCVTGGLQTSITLTCPQGSPCGPSTEGEVACLEPICLPGETAACFDNAVGSCAADGRSLATTTVDCKQTDQICNSSGACAASVTELLGPSLEVEAFADHALGNEIEVHSPRRITKLEAHLLLEEPRDLRWWIIDDTGGGHSTEVNVVTTNNVGSAFFTSPPLDFQLEAGRRYIFAVGTVVGDGFAYHEPNALRRRLSFGSVVDSATSAGAIGPSTLFALRITTTSVTNAAARR